MAPDLEQFDEQECELELVYIAAKVAEAQRVEAILEEQGIEYTIQVEQYRSGVIFSSVRAGAFFYVLPEAAARCREGLKRLGYKVQEPLA
jgi:hypothetical protein